MYVDPDSLVVSKETFEKYNNVGKAFNVLQTKMIALLRKVNFYYLRRACILEKHHTHDVKLTQELVKQILMTKNIDDLLDLLVCTSYCSWIDIRILEVMVIVSGSSQAVQLLQNYTDAVYSKRLFDVLPNVPSKILKEEYYSIIKTKIKKDHNEVTVADLLKYRSKLERVIMDINKGVCILKHVEQGCIEAYWYIPTSCVDRAYQNAKANSGKFNDLYLQYVTIGEHSPIFDPQEKSNHDIISVSSPSVNAGKYIFTYVALLLFCSIQTGKDATKLEYANKNG